MQRYFSFIIAALALVLTSCGKPFQYRIPEGGAQPDLEGIIPVEEIRISLSRLTIEEGNAGTLTVEVLPENATDKEVTWSVSDASVLAAEQLNATQARFEAVSSGIASVRATSKSSGKYVRCTITVTRDGGLHPSNPDPDPTPDPEPDPDPTPDPTPDPDPTPTPGPDPDPTPGPTPGTNTRYHNYYELPVINDANKDGKDDNDHTLFYAQHHFTMNNKDYRNYTVCFSSEHHCPVWVAAPRHSCYVGGTGRTETYGSDPVIESLVPGVQYRSKSTGGGCNKGHMLGSAERTCVTKANNQVFYYSNIAPQLSSGFNTGGGGWNILEDFVDSKVPADTLYEVIGCYFDKYTDGYGNTVNPSTISFGGRTDVDMPTMFYYLVLRTKKGNSGKPLSKCSASELQCVAFVRSHTNALKGQKVTSKEMMSVADLEKITGMTFFPNVPNAPKNTFSTSDWGL